MTISNEHPDMSGNILDQPYWCDHCKKQLREEDAYGLSEPRTMEEEQLIFCSGQCAEEFADARRSPHD